MIGNLKRKSYNNVFEKIRSNFGPKMLSLFGNARGRKKKPQLARLPILFKIHPIKQYNRKEFSNDNDPECFHRAIGSILFLSQFFGILPINHIRAVNIKKFSFKSFSPRTIYSYCILFTIFIMTLISVVHLLKTLNTDSFQTKGGISDATIGAVFYGNSLIGNIMFLRLCPRWISIQYDWRAMEQILDDGCNKDRKWKKPALRWRFTIISWTILSLALLEHVLSMVKNVPLADWGSHSFGDFIFVYTKKSHHFIIQNIDYNFLLGLFIFVVSKIATFTWNFTDLFIMIISTAIAERYKCLNERIIKITPERVTIADWYKFRQSYAILSTLVKKIDNEISGIVLLSFTNNIYFICLQLLNGLSPNNSENPIMNSIYFFGSFIFLIGRTTAVTLLTARINDQCKVILPVLYNCPSINYCLEAQRLQNQICSDDVALTGHRFFSITRNFMLAVAGAIVTYEVVLLQFNIALQRD